MTHPYDPIHDGHTITIVDTILPGKGFKARFYINKGESHPYISGGIPCLKQEDFVDEVSNTPQEAVDRAVERAHAWIDAQPRD